MSAYSGWNRRYSLQQRHRSADRPRRQAGPAARLSNRQGLAPTPACQPNSRASAGAATGRLCQPPAPGASAANQHRFL